MFVFSVNRGNEIIIRLLSSFFFFFFVRKNFEKTKLVAFLCVSWYLISAAETVSISTYLRALPDFRPNQKYLQNAFVLHISTNFELPEKFCLTIAIT